MNHTDVKLNIVFFSIALKHTKEKISGPLLELPTNIAHQYRITTVNSKILLTPSTFNRVLLKPAETHYKY